MSATSLIEYIAECLIKVGYQRISTPFSVAGIRFDFAAALQGRNGRSSDLVLLIDTSLSDGSGAVGERTRQRLEALCRALDVADSHLVLTAVLAGAALPPSMIEAIAKGCRVLMVTDDPRTVPVEIREAAQLEFEDRLRVLLPLQLGDDSDDAADPLSAILNQLPSEKLRSFAKPFLDLSMRGDKAVTRALQAMLEDKLSKGLPE